MKKATTAENRRPRLPEYAHKIEGNAACKINAQQPFCRCGLETFPPFWSGNFSALLVWKLVRPFGLETCPPFWSGNSSAVVVCGLVRHSGLETCPPLWSGNSSAPNQRLTKYGAGRVQLCGLNTASLIAGSAVLDRPKGAEIQKSACRN